MFCLTRCPPLLLVTLSRCVPSAVSLTSSEVLDKSGLTFWTVSDISVIFLRVDDEWLEKQDSDESYMW
jgi:hypothetical protein